MSEEPANSIVGSVSEYIEVENGVIVGHFCGQMPDEDRFVPVPDRFQGSVGMDLRAFSEDWELKPLADLVELGLVELPSGYKAVGQDAVPMSDAELVQNGTISMDEFRQRLCAKATAKLDEILSAGFEVSLSNGTFRFAVNSDRQNDANTILAEMSLGADPAWPYPWPDANDEPMHFVSRNDFIAYVAAGRNLKQQASQSVAAIKVEIRAAGSVGQAQDLFEAWTQGLAGSAV